MVSRSPGKSVFRRPPPAGAGDWPRLAAAGRYLWGVLPTAPKFDFDVAIVGAGPAGMACALALRHRGLRPQQRAGEHEAADREAKR